MLFRSKIPDKCPCGKFQIIKLNNETVQRCNGGSKCPYQYVESLKHFVSKKAMNIDGLGEKQIEKFMELKFISKKLDIYYLDRYKKKIIKTSKKITTDDQLSVKLIDGTIDIKVTKIN